MQMRTRIMPLLAAAALACTAAATAKDPPGNYVVIDERHNAHYKPTPGGPAVSQALRRWKPIPDDRRAFFAPIDLDPAESLYPRQGWWMYVSETRPVPHGWEAEVIVRLRFDAAKCTGPGRPSIYAWWVERWLLVDGELTYLGGHPGTDVPPRIGVGRLAR